MTMLAAGTTRWVPVVLGIFLHYYLTLVTTLHGQVFLEVGLPPSTAVKSCQPSPTKSIPPVMYPRKLPMWEAA